MSEALEFISDIVTARFRIVTPMFLGGAQQQLDGIRPPSVKGVLRFWWRALNWGRFRTADGATDESALRAMHACERRFFGSAAQEDKHGRQIGGQGIFLLSVKGTGLKSVDTLRTGRFSEGPFDPASGKGETYLLGMGLKSRPCYVAGEFELRIRFTSHATQSDRASVINAVKAFGLFGGLGARTRRGCGSVAIQSLTGAGDWSPPVTVQEYKQAVLNQVVGMSALHDQSPPFSAFCKGTRIWLSQVGKDGGSARQLWDRSGQQLLRFRSNGTSSGDLRIILDEQKHKDGCEFWDDHDLMAQAAANLPIEKLPRRLIFGLPHNYRFSNGRSIRLQDTINGRSRRASPLFMHVHEINRTPVVLQMTLISKFLPADEKVRVGRNRVPVEAKWDVLKTWCEKSRKETIRG